LKSSSEKAFIVKVMEDDKRETCWWIYLLEKLVLSAAGMCRNYSEVIWG
jgi:hypothetical protein